MKRPEGSMIWGAYVLADDEYGTWLYTPERSIVRGQRSGVSGSSYVGVPEEPGLHVLHLVPTNSEWWFGTWAVDCVGQRTSIDICTPPMFADGLWSYVDLELDLYRRDATVGIFDQDEFDEACRAGLITTNEAATCVGTAAGLDARLRGGDVLLDNAVWEHLATAVRLTLQPLTEVPSP